MNDIIINGTKKLPTVNLDSYEGLIEITGRSIPEDGKEFYDEIIKWIKEYRTAPRDKTTVIFKFEYLNSSSHLSVKNIITELNALHADNKAVHLDWYYEFDDTSMYEIANDYKELATMDFEVIRVDKF
jgi:hypothetical protein